MMTGNHTGNGHNSRINLLKKILLSCFCFLIFEQGQAQIVRAGLKIGGQLSWTTIEDASFKDTVRSKPTQGISAGLVFSFKVKNRYFLHTEYLYTTKTKLYTGKVDPRLKDRVSYNYFEVPIMFSMHFRGKVGKDQNFKWYGGVGPNIAYLLGGRGKIQSTQLLENDIREHSYKLKFEERRPNQDIDHVYYSTVNRLQFGINIGAGILFEPIGRHKFMLDLRYTFDQTLFANGMASMEIPQDYEDNLRTRNKSLRLSVMYLIESNINKKQRNKGKSNKRR
jgi:hypothetical protein